MMKAHGFFAAVLAMASLLFFSVPASASVWEVASGDAPFHIGIATGTVSQAEDELRGAELMLQKYGDSEHGGMITHITYPDNFMSEMETTIGELVGLADDPMMKVIVVNQAVPGTTEAFRRIHEKRPDIILLAGTAHEDPGVITQAADLAVNVDSVARAYLMVHTAHELGVKTYVHISFPRHLSNETTSRRIAIMREACKDMGMKFAQETVADPLSDVGVAGAQQFILEKVPEWLNTKYGKDTAFYCTSDALVEPLLKRIAALGGYFIEADMPSPLMGYPGALGIDLVQEKGNWPAILKKVEEAVVKAGGSGRMGTWAYSAGFTATAGLAEYGKRIVEGQAKLGNVKNLMDCYEKYAPGAKWKCDYYTDAGTGVRNKKFLMVRQDTYLFGKGYMGTDKVEVPEKYFLAH